MFRGRLEEAARRLPECRAVLLVGRDGMVVESWTAPGAPSADDLAAELTPVLRAVEGLARNSGGGEVAEITIRLESWTCFVQPVTPEIFLLLVAGRQAFPGRLRFEGGRASARLEADLR